MHDTQSIRAFHGNDFAGAHLADRLGADQIEGAGLRRHDQRFAEASEDERAETVWIARRENFARCQHSDGIRALDARQRIDQRALEIALPRSRDEMHHHLGVTHGVEDRAFLSELAPQLGAVDQVAVVRDRNQSFAGRRDDRLRVAKHRSAGGRVTDVTDGSVAGQASESLVREDVGDMAHLLLDVHLRRAGRDDLLPGARRADGLA